MKKKTVFTLIMAVLVACLCFAACTPEEETPGVTYEIKADKSMVLEKGESKTLEYTVTANGQVVTDVETTVTVDGESVTYSKESNQITAVKSGISKITIALKDDEAVSAQITVNVPGYTIEFNKESMSIALGESAPLVYTVKKDGAKVTDVKVKLTVEGDAVTANALTKTVTAKKVGTATLIATLESDETVSASMQVEVKDTFFNRDEATRGDIDFSKEDQGAVKVNGGQATVTVKEASTKFVFKTTVEILSSLTTDTSVGIGSFFDEGNHALWFGLRGTGTDGVYDVYVRDFYESWGSPAFDSTGIGNYNGYRHGTTVELVIVRDGDDYWYSLGGLNGYYHDNSGANTNEPTYPGIYAQEKMLNITDFSVSYTTEDVEAAKTALSAQVAKLMITNSNNALLSAGGSFEYKAMAYASGTLTEAIEWTLDKAEMTSGLEGTTINNGKLVLAEDAAGYVTVKASCGGKEATVRVEIVNEKLDMSTDKVAVSGGVQLDTETNKITFSVDRNHNNPTLDMSQYEEVPYMAKLLSTIKGDFTLTFKVKGYIGDTLLVSMGGKGNNFVIGNGTVTGYTYNVSADGSWQYNKEGNASNTIANFDAAAEHTYVISVVGGKYSVSVDGVALKFAGQAVRRAEDYVVESNIMFTTKAGTSCEVYDIEVESKGSTLGDWYIYSGNATEKDGKLEASTPALGNNGWDGKDYWITKYTYIKNFIPTGNFSMKANVKFNGAAGDTKAVFCIGNFEFHICNKLSSDGHVEGEYFNGNWGGGKETIPGTIDDVYVVEIQKIDDTVYFFINGILINKHTGMNAGEMLYFYTFNGNDADASNSVTVSDVQIHNGFLKLEGPASAKTGLTTTYVATVYGVGEVTWILDASGLTAGSASLENGVLTLSGDAVGNVVITASVGNYSQSIVVTASEQAADQDTDIATSVGGVLQDEDNGKLIFSEDKANVNGVANETKFQLSDYYALLNKKAGQPWAISGDFSVEFTVANYKTTAQYPKLMISLGGTCEQFYVVYFQDGSAQIQTYAWSLDENNNQYGGQWVNSAKFENFDPTAAHTYKIECINGFYKVYVDGNEVTGFNMDGQPRILFRDPGDSNQPCNIMMSTNGGTSCEVYGIKVTNEGAKNWQTVNPNVTVKDDGFVFGMTNYGHGDGWQNWECNSVWYSKYLPDNFVATFGVEFSGAMNDNKLEIELGGQLLHIENKLNAGDKRIQICHRNWGLQWYTESNQKMYIMITRYNGVIKAYVRAEGENEWTEMADLNGFTSDTHYFKFAAFIGDNGNGSVTVSQMDVMDYEIARSENDNMTSSNQDFTLTFKHQDWLNEDDVESVATFYNREIPEGDIDISFKVSFSGAMQDAKLGVWMGSEWDLLHEFDICVSEGGNKAEIRGIWGGLNTSDWDISNLNVTLQVRGNQVTMVINGNYTAGTVQLTGERTIGFYARNKKDADYDKTVTVSEITVAAVV